MMPKAEVTDPLEWFSTNRTLSIMERSHVFGKSGDHSGSFWKAVEAGRGVMKVAGAARQVGCPSILNLHHRRTWPCFIFI